MMITSPSSIPCFCVLFLLVVSSCSANVVDFIYQGFQHANPTLDGSASVLHGGALQLTNDSNRLVGHVFHGSPVCFLDGGGRPPSSFSTAFILDIVTIESDGG